MKLKEINRTAHISWSPSKLYPCYIACGTAAQQLDASFSTTSCLELHRFDTSNLNQELSIDASIQTESRFNKLLWNDHTSNLIIGGCENGAIYLYDYEKVLSKSAAAIVNLNKHTGAVGALDINPLQPNLLASGAGSSEIFIWDLNNPSQPSVPGGKLLPMDDVHCVAWNHQVPHILASTSSGKCVVWDLKKNESIIKISDSTSKMRAKMVAWHPDVATQLCLASEDDHSSQLQMWDLRFATAPVKLFSGHTRGVLTFAWCPTDSSLMVSCGKDNQIFCWNPNTNSNNVDVVLEIPSSQWCFDVSWCPRYPHLISTASYESIVSVYSLMGGKYDIKPETSNKIMDSFGVSNGPSLASQPAPMQQQIIPQLKLAPKWMKRPCGVSFGFGGKLVSFEVDPTATAQASSTDSHQPSKFQAQKVTIMQIVTDNALVEESHKLENALQSGQLLEFCSYKIKNVQNNSDAELWTFIQESFNADKKSRFVDLLGFNGVNLNEKIQKIVKTSDKKGDKVNLSSKLNDLNLNTDLANGGDPFAAISQAEASRPDSPINLSFNNQTDNLLCESLLLGNYESAVELCISEDRYTDAILIASFAGKDLLNRTQECYFKNSKNKFSKFLEGYLSQDWVKIVSNCNLSHWKEVLAAVLTYTNGEKLYELCNLLGNRLENESHLLNACICYICSSNLDKLIESWLKIQLERDNSKEFSLVLQDVIEKIMILQYSIQNVHKESTQGTQSLSKVLTQYSKLLAEQGCFLTALNYVKDSHDPSLLILKDRLYNALGNTLAQQYGIAKPDNPFRTTQHTNVKSNVAAPSSRGVTSHLPTPSPAPSSQNKALGAKTNSISHSHPSPQPGFFNPTMATTPVSQPGFFNPTPVGNSSFQNRFPTQTANNNHQTQDASLNTQPTNVFVPSAQNTAPPGQMPQSTLSYQEVRPTTAWNDPPIVPPKVKAPVVPKDTGIDQHNIFQPSMQYPTAPGPSFGGMHSANPSFGMNSPAPGPSFGGMNTTTANMYQMQQPIQNGTTQYQQPINNNFFNPINNSGGFNQMANNVSDNRTPTPTAFTPATSGRKVSVPVVQPKQPMPQEYAHIQATLDDLLKRCSDQSTQPIVKRKLEDVAKKLEVMYDKLRDKSLSESVIQGVQSILQYIQAHDYHSSLALHTQIVATSNFSEISGFMPSVKVLIQSCQQLNI